MPIYEYCCSACGETFELIQKIGDPAPENSPCCSAPSQRALSVPARHSNLLPRSPGKTCCGRDERCEIPPCSGRQSCCHE